jgi:NAD-dependent deacetylase
VPTLDEQIEELAGRMKSANRIVFLTGAGISTPSGIPDFRGTNPQNQHIVNLSKADFSRNTLEAYRTLWPFVLPALDAKPNFAHIYSVQLLKKPYVEYKY